MNDIYLQVLLAIICGGLIGIEREFRDKSAGFRTLIMICIGAVVFTNISITVGAPEGDSTRIASYIVSGIGFLGAGVILKEGNRITGLTTAATIWLTAAVGVAIGSGFYSESFWVTITALSVLWFLPYLERYIDNIYEYRTYEITVEKDHHKLDTIVNKFQRAGLKVFTDHLTRDGNHYTSKIKAYGRPSAHAVLVEDMIHKEHIKKFSY